VSGGALPVLAVDLGGTKTLLGLVRGGVCGPAVRIATPAEGGPQAWLDAIAGASDAWRGGFAVAAIAVTGLVAGGRWWALNPQTLSIPPGFPLVEELQRRLGVPVQALNDAQAAAWGEYRFGAGQGCDLVFVTVSTGIGAGMVLGGRLLIGRRGLAGHLGQLRCGEGVEAPWLEHLASGTALAHDAAVLGHPGDVAGLFAAAEDGAAWAELLLDRASRRVAGGLASLQALLDPDCIVIGGGVGLAPGFLARVRLHLAGLGDLVRPDLREAALGAQAGLLGVADFGEHDRDRGERP
jgi:predicted NBD/HSP70 family sugar kinase